ncbi:hypothetical protein EC973_007030 [Apophysomyces ossiformis]|uniref:Large ribosomal subunit protein mL50 n=1 Tax=Apophysomyces ossiformis TaxID=679940 RepID=A0A8H7EQ20_9FUNG|nr:hypothetical protein EC973_007030 [Apophysomyces ossiformis]
MFLAKQIVRVDLYKRTLYTSSTALSEGQGVFGRLNPWAKKTPTQQSEPAVANSSAEIDAVSFNVKYEEDEDEVVSWKNDNVIENAEEIESIVRNVVLENVQGANESSWKNVGLTDATVKFKVVKESIKLIGRDLPNATLNNVTSAADLLTYFQGKDERFPESVEQFFADNAESLPKNMTFEPRKKKLDL